MEIENRITNFQFIKKRKNAAVQCLLTKKNTIKMKRDFGGFGNLLKPNGKYLNKVKLI